MLALSFLLSALVPALAPSPDTVRIATFNASLNRETAGELVHDLSTPDDEQARNVAEIIQRVRPDVVLINEFDFDEAGRASDLFRKNYLQAPQNGAEPITYPYSYSGPVNTGVPSGVDLDGDGTVQNRPGSRGYGNDALGFGQFPGQYGMLLLSRFPIANDRVQTFGRILWKDVPGALLPTRADGSPWYSPEALAKLPLSSKNHWDIPVEIGPWTLHLLVSHPTPPAFDGPEDRNGKRNHDEIRLWADYLSGGEKSRYIGRSLPADQPFVILGDLNADPLDGGTAPDAIQQVLNHPRVQSSFVPASKGGPEASRMQGQRNTRHRGDPAHDTSDFSDAAVGNLRADYVLPSRELEVAGGGIFWPESADPLARLVDGDPPPSSDHRLVYLDLRVPSGQR